eukprot:54522_1
MTLSCSLILLLFFVSNIAYSRSKWGDWQVSPITLPSTCFSMAIGCKANKIWILGGMHYHSNQLVSYDININNFTTIDAGPWMNDVYGYSQFYTQMNDVLYMLNPNGSRLDQFNLNNQQFSRLNGPNIPINVGNVACLASFKNYLIVMGGESAQSLRAVQILNIYQYKWLSNIPSLQVARQVFSCIVHNNIAYAIGGSFSETDKISSIEKLSLSDMDNIQQEQWTFIDSLKAKMDGTRAIIHENNIFVFPGQGCGLYCHDINIIDTNTGNVTVSNAKLNYTAGWSGVIIVNDVMYAFGGYNQAFIDIWQYSVLPVPANSVNWFYIAPLILIAFICFGAIFFYSCKKQKRINDGYQMQHVKLSYGGVSELGEVMEGYQKQDQGMHVIDTAR